MDEFHRGSRFKRDRKRHKPANQLSNRFEDSSKTIKYIPIILEEQYSYNGIIKGHQQKLRKQDQLLKICHIPTKKRIIFDYFVGQSSNSKKQNFKFLQDSEKIPNLSSSLQSNTKAKKSNLLLNKQLFIKIKNLNIRNFYDWDENDKLGGGTYGKVYKARNKYDKNIRAIKVIKKSTLSDTNLMNEARILATLDHPNIVKLFQVFEDDFCMYLVIDYCEGGQFLAYLQRKGQLTEKEAKIIFCQILQAVSYCHQHKICHRDLKLENFMLLKKQTMTICLIDFGLAFRWKHSMANELKMVKQGGLLGTACYLSPQMISGKYDERCDIWAMGVILYILLTADSPFAGQDNQQVIHNIMKNMNKFKTNNGFLSLNSSAKDLISKMLRPANTRITLCQIFQHQWVVAQASNRKILKLNYKKMANCAKFSKLKLLAITYIASQMSEKDIQRLGEQFKQIDINHDGYITVEELENWFKRQSKNPTMKQLAQLVKFVGTDKQGRINYTQFVASCLQNSIIYKEQNLLKAFKMLDVDDNGFISREQLKKIINSNQTDMNSIVIQDIMASCDTNKDGKISYNEFLKCIIKL